MQRRAGRAAACSPGPGGTLPPAGTDYGASTKDMGRAVKARWWGSSGVPPASSAIVELGPQGRVRTRRRLMEVRLGRRVALGLRDRQAEGQESSTRAPATREALVLHSLVGMEQNLGVTEF